MNKKILEEVDKYYTEKLKTFGATPAGVDWNGEESQENRFKQLLKVVDPEESGNSTILDYGCGFGSLFNYIQLNKLPLIYSGFDISPEMINTAKNLYSGVNWYGSLPDNYKTDYVVASGIFNVKQNQQQKDWEEYIFTTLNTINQCSLKGFAFNVLTSYSDTEFMKDHLYYANPSNLFDYCKRNFSKEVALLHDYKLYEFTIIVRK